MFKCKNWLFSAIYELWNQKTLIFQYSPSGNLKPSSQEKRLFYLILFYLYGMDKRSVIHNVSRYKKTVPIIIPNTINATIVLENFETVGNSIGMLFSRT